MDVVQEQNALAERLKPAHRERDDLITNVIEYIRDGRLRPLAVTTATRAELLPDIPAMSEFLPGYDATGWNGKPLYRILP
jgi:hypothetical protein